MPSPKPNPRPPEDPLTSEQVLGHLAQPIEVVHVAGEERNPHHRGGVHRCGQTGEARADHDHLAPAHPLTPATPRAGTAPAWAAGVGTT